MSLFKHVRRQTRLNQCQLMAAVTAVIVVVLLVFLMITTMLTVWACESPSSSQLLPPSSPWRIQSSSLSQRQNDSCVVEYKRVTAESRLQGLTEDDLERSIAHVGNRQRLAKLTHKLQQRLLPVSVVVCGGSISLGHGIEPRTLRYSNQLEQWLNTIYPLKKNLKNGDQKQSKHEHRVYNRGSHGADMCAMAKRMNLIDFPVFAPDMFILEFAVNDYQGQDHKVQIDYKTDAFFDGFKRLAACAEIVVYKLLADYPDSAVVFLEFQTAILNRKTAQLLHMGVAQHYQVPVISYADAMWPDFYRLLDKLEPFGYSIPKTMDISSILPYPHGCAPCDTEGIEKAFRDYGCKSVCVFMKRSGYYTEEECDAASKRYQPCYVPFFAHDAVHPSVIGHRIARDLIANVIAHTALLTCQGRMFSDHLLPTHSGWLVAGINYQSELRARSDFVLVKDTMEIFAKQDPLLSNKHTAGFQLEMDEYYRKGWIATNPSGGERVTFDIDLRPATDCYAVYLSVLKSYATVGTFTFTVEDLLKKKDTPPVTIDCLWEPQISIPVDIKLTANSLDCSGKCKVTITTNPEIPGRGGNLVKIMSLSVRKCMSASKEVTSAL